MITTGSEELANKLAILRSHGVTKDPALISDARPDDGGWYYEQHELGFNYRISDIQAALGLSQVRKIDTFMAARRDRARRYGELLSGLPLHLPLATDKSSWHLYVVRLDQRYTNVTRKAMFDTLRDRGIEAHVHYIPIHTQPYYRALGFSSGDFPQSETYYDTCLSIPIYPLMTDEEQDFVTTAITDVLAVA